MVRKWSKEKIVEEIVKHEKSGHKLSSTKVSEQNCALWAAGKRYFGSWDNATIAAGFGLQREAPIPIKWTEDKVLSQIKNRVTNNEKLNPKSVIKDNHALFGAANRIFGSWENALHELGIDYADVCNKWSKERISKEVTIRCKEKLPLSFRAMMKENPKLLDAGIRTFGSWKSTIEKVLNIPYQEIRKDSLTNAYYGHMFERMLTDLLREVGVKFSKGFTNEIRPDYVMLNGIWLDAKLSEWSIYSSSTIEKYEPLCKLLIVIYMRGNDVDKMLTPKTRLISVKRYIKQLPKNRQAYYLEEIKKIEYEVTRIESELNAPGRRSTDDPDYGNSHGEVS